MRLEKRGRRDQSGCHRSRKTGEYNQPEIPLDELVVTAGMLGYWKGSPLVLGTGGQMRNDRHP